MALLITSSPAFDSAWQNLVAPLQFSSRFDLLQALKESLRDYLSLVGPVSELEVQIEAAIFKLAILSGKSAGDRPSIKLQGIEAVCQAEDHPDLRPAFKIVTSKASQI